MESKTLHQHKAYDLRYCGGVGLNPQYLRGLPVHRQLHGFCDTAQRPAGLWVPQRKQRPGEGEQGGHPGEFVLVPASLAVCSSV